MDRSYFLYFIVTIFFFFNQEIYIRFAKFKIVIEFNEANSFSTFLASKIIECISVLSEISCKY